MHLVLEARRSSPTVQLERPLECLQDLLSGAGLVSSVLRIFSNVFHLGGFKEYCHHYMR